MQLGLNDGQYTEWRGDDAEPGLEVLVGRAEEDAAQGGGSRRFRMF